jgi:aminopeptidase N
MRNRVYCAGVLLGAWLCLGQLTTTLSGGEAPAPRHYAPSREMDLIHLALDITPDFRQRTIAGRALLRFKPIAQPLRELRLDAIDLSVTNLAATDKVSGWQVTREKIVVSFDPPLPPDREASVTIDYRAQPTEGLFFRTPELGYPAQDEHLWTQGEAISARHWYPGFDSPNEKFTTEMTCRVPEGMVVLSNGRKLSEVKTNGLMAVRWLQDKPHANYLVSLAAGHFQKAEGRHKEIPLAFWTVPSDSAQGASSFAGTREMMAFFEQETGVPYPWARYDQVCVLDFVAGGMENTTLTILTSDTLFTPETENVRSSQGLVAHELAHQWFGDLVTCKDWSQLWLNEGFATYYEHLYDEHKQGHDEFLYRMLLGARSIAGQAGDSQPIVFRGYNHPDELFDWRAYGKGAWVLHMLRSQLGPDLYRACIKTYLERHRYGNVVTENLNAVVEELSGRSFDQFFDQWVYHAGIPDLAVDYAWDEGRKLAKITVRQTQPLNESVLLFRSPLTIRFKSKAGSLDREITLKGKTEDYYFSLPQAPEIVRIDPNLAVLAKVEFHPPGPLIEAQLADESDVVGRLRAIEELQSRKDHQTVAQLKKVLNQDSFYGVRTEAAAALRGLHSDEAFEALLASTRQSDARVRRAVVAELGRFYREAAWTEMLRVLKEEKNPDILAEAIQALAACPWPEARTAVLQFLRSTSYRNHLADAAIRALRAQEDASNVEPLIEVLRSREADFTSRTLAEGLGTLARLARGQTNRDSVREFIVRSVSHPREQVRWAAVGALGVLEDPRALPVLETVAGAAKGSREQKAAQQAIEAIRTARKGPVELGELRKEVLDLQKQNRELRQEFEAWRKQLEAAGAGQTNVPAKPAAKRR